MKQSKRLKPNAIPKIKSTLEGRRTESEPAEKEEQTRRSNTRDKVVLEPLVSPDLAIYIFKQVKVKMTLDLVMSPCMSNMKLLIVYL